MDQLNKPKRPVLIDESIHTAFTIKYIIYSLFGLAGVMLGVGVIEDLTSDLASRTVAGVIAASGALSALAVHRALLSEMWERVELYSTICMCSFVMVYDVTAIVTAFSGNPRMISLALIATALLVFPVWRILQIVKKNRKQP